MLVGSWLVESKNEESPPKKTTRMKWNDRGILKTVQLSFLGRLKITKLAGISISLFNEVSQLS